MVIDTKISPLVILGDVDALAFWSDLSTQARKFAMIDVPDDKPIPGLPGIQLANWATHNNWDPHYFDSASEPPELLQKVYRDFGPKLTTVENHESSFQEDRQIYRRLIGQVEKSRS